MKLEIIGHRGSSYDAPENTVSSVKLAFEENADGVEIDVRMTFDNKIVGFHDENTSRLSVKNKKIANCTLEELKKIDIGVWKADKWKGTEISTLQEILDVTPSNKKVFIEFKCQESAFIELKNILGGLKENIVIVSFDRIILRASKNILPDIPVYWIQDLELDSYLTDWIFEQSKKDGINGFMFSESAIDSEIVKIANQEKLAIYSWTVNSPMIAKEFMDLGVTGIITDRPGWIRSQLKSCITL